MAEIIQDPQLRYTSDTQTPIAEMLVEFPGIRAEDPPARLKVVGWGNLAQEIQESYHQGDRVVIEGRLSMNTIERPEGFKEKRAELTAQRIHRLDGVSTSSTSSATASQFAASTPSTTPSTRPAAPTTPNRNAAPSVGGMAEPMTKPAATRSKPPAPVIEPDYDDIPF